MTAVIYKCKMVISMMTSYVLIRIKSYGGWDNFLSAKFVHRHERLDRLKVVLKQL